MLLCANNRKPLHRRTAKSWLEFPAVVMAWVHSNQRLELASKITTDARKDPYAQLKCSQPVTERQLEDVRCTFDNHCRRSDSSTVHSQVSHFLISCVSYLYFLTVRLYISGGPEHPSLSSCWWNCHLTGNETRYSYVGFSRASASKRQWLDCSFGHGRRPE